MITDRNTEESAVPQLGTDGTLVLHDNEFDVHKPDQSGLSKGVSTTSEIITNTSETHGGYSQWVSEDKPVEYLPSGSLVHEDALAIQLPWPEPDETVPVQTDGGWGWVVCVTAMLTNGTVTGFLNSLSLVYVGFLDEFAEGDDFVALKTSWVLSMVFFMTFFMSPVAGVLGDRFGIQQVGVLGGFLAFIGALSSAFVKEIMLLYFTFGVLLGIGFSFCLSQSAVIVCHYFKKHLGLVYSLLAFGGGTFSIIFSLILPLLFDKIGVMKTLMVLSGLNFLMMLYALTWIPLIERKPSDILKQPDPKERGSMDGRLCHLFKLRLLKNQRYMLWSTGCAVATSGFAVALTHMVKFSMDNFPDSDAKLLPLSSGVSIATSRLLFGLVADRDYIKKSYMRIGQGVFITTGVITICLPTISNFLCLIVAAVFLGVGDGIFFLLVGPVVASLVGVEDTSQAIGFFFGFISLPLSAGISVAGVMYDELGNYTLAFHCLGSACIMGSLLMCLMPFASKKYRKRRIHVVYVRPISPHTVGNRMKSLYKRFSK